MSTSILATKLYIPPPRPKVVSRARLIEQLNEGLKTEQALVHGNQRLAALFEQLSRDNSNTAAWQSLQEQLQNSRLAIDSFRGKLAALDYPYSHAQGRISLANFALKAVPPADNPAAVYEAAGCLIESTSRLRARLMGHLCAMAEQVESALGLPPLEEPQPTVPSAEDASSPARS